jgi:hypothetical protein
MLQMGRIPVFLAALWWGGISAISFMVVPVLFAQVGNPSIAGTVAARLFSIQSIAMMAIAVLLLAWRTVRGDRWLIAVLALAISAALVQELGIAPRILQARLLGESIRVWHSLGTICILLQWATGSLVLYRLLKLHTLSDPLTPHPGEN